LIKKKQKERGPRRGEKVRDKLLDQKPFPLGKPRLEGGRMGNESLVFLARNGGAEKRGKNASETWLATITQKKGGERF